MSDTRNDFDHLVEKSIQDQKRVEANVFRELRRSYKEIEADLLSYADEVLQEAAENPNRFLEHRRTLELLSQVRDEMQRYADQTIIPATARGMVQSSFLGSLQASEGLSLISSGVDRINLLPVQSIDEFTRFLTTGPLGELFQSFGDDAMNKARRDMLKGIALGQNPRKLARTLRDSLGISQQRALLIARTETMRAHREGNRKTYLRNKHRIKAWVWHAHPSERTCAACWALHGREFPLEQPMTSHPACRCTMVPKSRTWREMGFNLDEVAPPVPDGESLFAEQDEATQKAVLGRHYDRYKAGEITLNDFVRVKESRYGKTFTKKVPQ